MKTFVFFVGGTGARVLRSLTMLLASGVEIGKNEIVPIMIDYDVQNGDLEKSLDLMSRYGVIHDKGKFEASDTDMFFRASMRPSSFSVANIKNDGGRKTFSDFIDYNSLHGRAQSVEKLIESLYDSSHSSNPYTELNLDMSVGFKGNPNIGSVVFNDYFTNTSYGFDKFITDFPDDGRVFLVGSIFGGTGSSGLPQLIKRFRQDGSTGQGNNTALKDAMIGACVVLPYFSVRPEKTSAIDSMTFNTKAKSALDYYRQTINKYLNDVYYIGCDHKMAAYPNVEGGKDQHNNAHLVELLSAMSIIEFVNTPDEKRGNPDLSGTPNAYEFTATTGMDEKKGALNDVSYLDVLGLPTTEIGTFTKYVKPLCAFALFTHYCRTYLFSKKDAGGALGIGSQGYYKSFGKHMTRDTDFGQALSAFMESFIAWSNELSENSLLEFCPFDFTGDVDKMLNLNASHPRVRGIVDKIRVEMNAVGLQYKDTTIDETPKIALRAGSRAGFACVEEKIK